jgi:pyruvate/2-oxoglutarate dehydrogenase complex dihydrolipoamide acyltransferase (E2) component
VGRSALVMPKIGHDMEKGTVGGWLKQVGDRVRRGEAVAEIETDKSMIEMESPLAGTLVEIVAGAGTQLPVGEVIGYVETDEA